MPKESISFPAFKFQELVNEEWDDSNLKNKLEKKFFFVFFQFSGKKLILKKILFWNMPIKDLEQAKNVWKQTIDCINNGNIVHHVTDRGIRYTNFPNMSDTKVIHVRPHGRNRKDTYPLVVRETLTGADEYTKQCFWINADYVKDNIYNSGK